MVGQLPAVLGGRAACSRSSSSARLSANWAQIVVAPTGCTIGNPAPGKPGYKIDPGFALGFDGQVGPAPVTFTSPRCARARNGQLRGREATVRVGAFDAGPVAFRRTALDLDIDTGGAPQPPSTSPSPAASTRASRRSTSRAASTPTTPRSAPTWRGRRRLRLAGTTFARRGAVLAKLEFAKRGRARGRRAAQVDARTRILPAPRPACCCPTATARSRPAAGSLRCTARRSARWGCAPARAVRLRARRRAARRQPQRLLDRAPGGGARRPGADAAVVQRDAPRSCLLTDKTLNLSLPQQWDFDFVVPRSEVGALRRLRLHAGRAALVAAGRAERAQLLGPQRLARAGGCVSMLWWKKCADGVNVGFNPNNGKFEGSFIGIPVSWGLTRGARARRRRPRRRRRSAPTTASTSRAPSGSPSRRARAPAPPSDGPSSPRRRAARCRPARSSTRPATRSP